MTGKIVTVDFRNDTLFAAERDDGVYIAVTPICTTLGLAPQRQRERIQKDPILSEGGTVVVLPSPGGMQETYCLRLDLVNGWLFTIDESRVKDEETRQKVLSYKRECYAVLFQHFYGKTMSARGATIIEPQADAETNDSDKLRKVNEARHVFGHRAAAELWFHLGLPIVPAMLHDPRQFTLDDYARVRSAEDVAA